MYRFGMRIVLLSILAASASAQDMFAPAVNYAAGDGPHSVFSIDFNGDGNSDLATANAYSGNVSILLGNGDGTFQSAVNYAVGDGPYSVFSTDFNGDGNNDLVTANAYSDNVSILLGNGDGTFQVAVDYAAGDLPSSVFSIDFNGDGYNDLATANHFSDNVSILLGNGDGTFQSAVNYAAGDHLRSVFSVDLNGDGDNDLATANYASNNVSILLGNGDGTFQSAVNYAVGGWPISVFSIDLNGDGDCDLATANIASGNVSILLGNGDGTFQSAVNYATGAHPINILSTDFDGDGNNDLATAISGTDNVSILLGNGDGTFQSAVSYAAGDYPSSVFSIDLDGDGDNDLVTANASSGNVSILLNLSDEVPPAFCDEFTGLFCDDFETGADPLWTTLTGSHPGSCTWSVTNGSYGTSQSGVDQMCIQSVLNGGWQNYVYEVDVRGNAGVNKEITFRSQDGLNTYDVNLLGDPVNQIDLNKVVDGISTNLTSAVFPSQIGVWYNVKVACVNSIFTVSVDDTQVLQYTDTDDPFLTGGIGLVNWTGTEGVCDVSFDNVAVTDPFLTIEFSSHSGEYVGDVLTISGTVTTSHGVPFQPVYGTVGVEDPVSRMTALVDVNPDGTFSYSTTVAADWASAYLFLFLVGSDHGAVQYPFVFPVASPVEPEGYISPHQIRIETGPTDLSDPATDAYAVRAPSSSAPPKRESIFQKARFVYEEVKATVATEWKKHTSEGISGAMYTNLGMHKKRCSQSGLFFGDCVNMVFEYGILSLNFPIHMMWEAFYGVGEFSYETGHFTDCEKAEWDLAVESGNFLIGFVPIGSANSFEAALAVVESVGNIAEANKLHVFWTACGFEEHLEGGVVLVRQEVESALDQWYLTMLLPKLEKAAVFRGLSPITLQVTDSQGRVINSTINDIPLASYARVDSDFDGVYEEIIIVPLQDIGDLEVEVIPEPGAQPDELFTVIADYTYFEEPLVLADNARIDAIPPEPYVVTTFENLPPGSFSLVAPSSGVFNVPFTLPIEWAEATDPNPGHEVAYDILFATDAAFTDSVVIYDLAGTEYTLFSSELGDSPDGQYYWKVRAHDSWYASVFSSVTFVFTASPCCSDRVGDANNSGNDEPTIGDISVMIDHLFINGSALVCYEEADINQSGTYTPASEDITIGDISYLIDYLFITGPSLGLPDCL